MKKLFSYSIPNWLFFTILGLIVLRIPTFFEPYYYGDEMIYLAIGNAMRKGVLLYKEIYDHKTPLLYLVSAISGNLFMFKSILLVWHALTVVAFWNLAKTLFPSNIKLHKASTIMFGLLTTIPFWEGPTVNAELFMIGPTIIAFTMLLRKKQSVNTLLFGGIFLSIATLFKVPSLFEIPTVFFYWFASTVPFYKSIVETVKRGFVIAAGFLLPVLVTIIYFWSQNALGDYLQNALLVNFGYIAAFNENVKDESLLSNSPLFMRGILTVFGLALLFAFRKKVSSQFLFISAWLFLTLFAIALPERPYPHYLLQAVAPLSLLFAMLFTLKTLEQSLVIFPLTVFFFVVQYFSFWQFNTKDYYTRFISLATKKITRDEYFSSFGNRVLDNYKIASYVSATIEDDDTVYVWGDTSTIYALTKTHPPIKYITDFHTLDLYNPKKVIEELDNYPPEFIIIYPEGPSFPELLSFTSSRYVMVRSVNEIDLWKLVRE